MHNYAKTVGVKLFCFTAGIVAEEPHDIVPASECLGGKRQLHYFYVCCWQSFQPFSLENLLAFWGFQRNTVVLVRYRTGFEQKQGIGHAGRDRQDAYFPGGPLEPWRQDQRDYRLTCWSWLKSFFTLIISLNLL